MPRESLHFYVAEKLLESFPELIPERELFFLGSVIHDSPYYLTESPFESVATRLHGTEGEDTLRPIFEMVSRAPGRGLFALAAGMLSHVAVDQVFHPAVYFLTGDYHASDARKRAQARWRHRAFEIALDLGIETLGRQVRFRDLLRKNENSLIELSEFLPESRVYPGLWPKAVLTHAKIDSISRSVTIGALLAPFSFIHKIEEGLALSVFQKTALSLDEELQFRNPVTGVSLCLTPREMLVGAISRATEYIQALSRGTQPMAGASLNFDLPGATSADAKYFLREKASP